MILIWYAVYHHPTEANIILPAAWIELNFLRTRYDSSLGHLTVVPKYCITLTSTRHFSPLCCIQTWTPYLCLAWCLFGAPWMWRRISGSCRKRTFSAGSRSTPRAGDGGQSLMLWGTRPNTRTPIWSSFYHTPTFTAFLFLFFFFLRELLF